jgi:HEAT repeat protein
VAYALGELGDVRAVGPLIDALGNMEVCGWAAYALGRLGDMRAVEPLMEALTFNDSWTLEKVVTALGRLGDKRAAELLLGILHRYWNGDVRKAAARALLTIAKENHDIKLDHNTIQKIREPHTDHGHYDRSDEYFHTDEGIGIEVTDF